MVNFRSINAVPSNKELIDIALNKTQRKTPTVIHPTEHISKIRSFYTRKVRFSSDQFTERLSAIIEQFPRLEDIHPFYSDLMNVLYDRDHYKMALGHVSSTKNAIDKVGKEYIKLLKYAENSYRAKQLKRAALGRMATIAKKLGKSMEYLEEVRQNLSRLPSIDPTSLSLILCGYPNVGKSSFINKISRAQVDVQPYAFTTKNLYVGHFDYNYLKWQVIDTPGILDHPIEEMNTIEMQTITALAHIHSSVLYFIDISTSCGYTVEEQLKLCESLEPVLGDFLVVLSKNDLYDLNEDNNIEDELRKITYIDEETRNRLVAFLSKRIYITMSSETENNVEKVKKIACEKLLNKRVEKKVSNDQVKDFMNRIMIIKSKVQHEQCESQFKNEKIILEKEKFENNRDGYVFDERENYFCDDKYDTIPEFYQGKNIADFIDPEIMEKLRIIEDEEENIDYDKKYDVFTKDEREYRELIGIRKKQREIIKNEKGRCAIPPRWIENRQRVDKPIDIEMKSKNEIVPVVIKKNEFRRMPSQRYFCAKPKHIYRSKGKKGSKNR